MQEANINLEVFNLETYFLGDLHCSSRFTDMLCDAQAQYQDYSELEKCPMWRMWENEGREWDVGRYGLWPLWQGLVSEDRADVAEADEDGGGRDGRDGIATYETISTSEKRRERWQIIQ